MTKNIINGNIPMLNIIKIDNPGSLECSIYRLCL